jgi:hypothetical protein
MSIDPNEMILVRSGMLEEALTHANLYLLIRDHLSISELEELTRDLQSGSEWDAKLTKR